MTSCGGGSSAPSSSVTSGSVQLPTLIVSSLIVDVNNDGKNDIIISSQGEGKRAPQVLINQDKGNSFTILKGAIPSQYMGINGAAVDLRFKDFNGDGKLDLLASTVDVSGANFYNASQIQLYFGNGDGTFTDATNGIMNNTKQLGWYDHLKVADFDGDGAFDFITTATNGTGGLIYLNNGSGSFAPTNITLNNGVNTQTLPSLQSAEVLVGDINNDGKPDMLAVSAWQVYLNTSTPGNLSFNQIDIWGSNGTNTNMQYGVLLDIDGDGNLDVVVSQDISVSAASTVPVYALKGDGLGHFVMNTAMLQSPPPGLVHGRQFLAADFNGDGLQDVLISDHGYDQGSFPGARNWLLLNNGGGKLVDTTAANLSVLPTYTHQAAIGDLNGDGSLDILLNNSSACGGGTMTCVAGARFWRNNGSGMFMSYNPTIQ